MVEYDTRDVNLKVALAPLSGLEVTLAPDRVEELGGGIVYGFSL